MNLALAQPETVGSHTGQDDLQVAEVLPRIYDQLLALARRFMNRERAGHTLEPTALVHEAFLKLHNHKSLRWVDRTHLIRIAARSMRQVLVTHAERRSAAKRGGGWGRVALDHVVMLFEEQGVDLLHLDEVLEDLRQQDERQAEVVELRFFGGLSVAETARALNVSVRTVEREWTVARAWLRRELLGRNRIEKAS